MNKIVEPWRYYSNMDQSARHRKGEKIGLAGVHCQNRPNEKVWVGIIFWNSPRIEGSIRDTFDTKEEAMEWVDKQLICAGYILIDKSKFLPMF